jgi:adenine deaminase
VQPMRAIQMATINCAQIYRIEARVGSISPGRDADILLVDDPATFRVHAVLSKGRVVARDGSMLAPSTPPPRSDAILTTFRGGEVGAADIRVPAGPATAARVLSMAMSEDVPFVRKRRDVVLPVVDGAVQPDVEQDVLYVAVVERFGRSGNRPVAFISGFGLKAGAMASSASPDDNNIVCIGTNPADMAHAVNRIARAGGGQVVVRDGEEIAFLPLPIGGIVADMKPDRMAEEETRLDDAARALGCRLPSAFMYMIFLSVTAIPDYAITDRGLVDCVRLEVIDPVLEPVSGGQR